MVRGVDADWDFSERRRCVRFTCRHKVDLVHEEDDGGKNVAYVLNYGVGGVRITYPKSLKIGEKIKLRFPHPLPGFSVRTLECEVIWRRKNPKTLEMLAGLKFVEGKERMQSSWVAYFLRERGATGADAREDRDYFRAECKLDVVARADDDRAVGHALNMGIGGALLALNRPAEPGDEWGLDISGLSSFPAFHRRCQVKSCEMGENGMYIQRVEFGPVRDEDTAKLIRKYMLALSKDFWTD